VFRELNKPRVTLVEKISNKFGLSSALNFQRFGILHVHIALLICLKQSPVKYVFPVRLNNLFDSVDIPISPVRLEVSLRTGVLPNGDCNVIHPLLFEPETYSRNECGGVSFVLALVVKKGVCVPQMLLDLTGISGTGHPSLKSAEIRQLNADLKFMALFRPSQLLLFD